MSQDLAQKKATAKSSLIRSAMWLAVMFSGAVISIAVLAVDMYVWHPEMYELSGLLLSPLCH